MLVGSSCAVQAPGTSDEDNSDLEVGDMLDDEDHDGGQDRSYHFLTQLKPLVQNIRLSNGSCDLQNETNVRVPGSLVPDRLHGDAGFLDHLMLVRCL